MPKVNDTEHLTVIGNIVHVWKVSDTTLMVMTSCHSSPVTLEFDSKAKRNSYFDALVAAIT